MRKLKNLFFNWRKSFKLSASNPENFDETWSVSTSKIQLISLTLLFILLIATITGLLFVKTPIGSYFGSEVVAINKDKIIDQKIELDKLSKKLDAQEKYINNIRMIISGKPPQDTIKKSKNEVEIDPNTIDASATKEETIIAEKVKNDQRTIIKKDPVLNIHFIAPVKGLVSQKFNSSDHIGIDIVTPKNKTVLACLSGTVIYSGYSQKDGHILIVQHANDFSSVYKHNQSRLKKTGDKVRTGDPIAIVGNTGENTNGSHLHFELWLNQKAVNPQEYIRFD